MLDCNYNLNSFTINIIVYFCILTLVQAEHILVRIDKKNGGGVCFLLFLPCFFDTEILLLESSTGLLGFTFLFCAFDVPLPVLWACMTILNKKFGFCLSLDNGRLSNIKGFFAKNFVCAAEEEGDLKLKL